MSRSPTSSSSTPPLFVAPGTRAAEAFLLQQVDRHLDAAAADWSLLARPLRIVVPSASLRLHLGDALVRHRGGGVAGVVIQSHFRLAQEILERTGEVFPAGRFLADLFPQRLARREPLLARPLEPLVDGLATVAATVRDLLDARLEPALAEGVDEALEALEEEPRPGVAGRAEAARARALLRVAVGTWLAVEHHGLGHSARLVTEAAATLRDGLVDLPASGVWIYGWADATGTAADLLEALQRSCDAGVILDRPPTPGAPPHPPFPGRPTAVPGPEGRFGRRLVERLELASAPRPVPDPPPSAPRLDAFTARGADGEAREVARRLAAALAEGHRPEGLAVVARDLTDKVRPLRRWLERLGVPFSGLAEPGPVSPGGRRLRALLDLLQRGRRTAAERWIEALESLPGAGAGGLRDLRLGLAAAGAGRLQEVAALDPRVLLGDRSSLPLPQRQGLGLRRNDPTEPAEDPGDDPDASDGPTPREGATRALRRSLGRPLLERGIEAARALLATLEDWPRDAPLADHRQRLEAVVAEHLGWPSATPAAHRLTAVLDGLEREAPAGLRLAFDELRSLLRASLRQGMDGPLGGAGGGVQVLTVTEARGRTFEHLFLMGLNRDEFPRLVREDPLLADGLRRHLQALLPDLPVKAEGFDEERHLFAQLLSASPRVTLSWQSEGQDGSPRPPSPLVERLGLEARRAVEPWSAPEATPPPATASRGEPPEPVQDRAIRVALHHGRGAFRSVFPVTVAAARRTYDRTRARLLAEAGADPRATASRLTPAALAAGRLALLDELGPDLASRDGRATDRRLGPHFGFLGPVAPVDPRRGELWVTTLERLAGCPWQVFLSRFLGLEPSPDPLSALPSIDPLLLGQVVHRVLEEVAAEGAEARTGDHAAAGGLGELVAGDAHRPPWPAAEALSEILERGAHQVLRDEGLVLPGLARTLAAAARPYLERARELDWGEGPPAVLGVEVTDRVAVGGVELFFRADRVDARDGSTGVLLTDYKTGRPLRGAGGSELKQAAKRRELLLAEVATGRRLQAAAYARAAGAEARGAGRYLFVAPGVQFPDYRIAADDRDFATAFEEAVGAALGIWRAGTFFPRLVDPAGEKEPPRCSWCPVAEACLRGDSGARRRLARWATGDAPGRAPHGEQATALERGWWLADPHREGPR